MMFKDHKHYRLSGRTYTEAGNYFITICTSNREEYLGKIEKGKMILSPIGKIANELWNELSQIYSNIVLDEFVVMPDHIHGIIMIKNNPNQAGNLPRQVPNKRSLIPNDKLNNQKKNLHPLIKNSISSIINHYKGSVKKWSNVNGYSFRWQSKFHDRIIRSDKEFYFVQKYIRDNPKKWEINKIADEQIIDEKIYQ
jgi:putative transposase